MTNKFSLVTLGILSFCGVETAQATTEIDARREEIIFFHVKVKHSSKPPFPNSRRFINKLMIEGT
ncbi:hypothetical protein [Avibacterium endocarditidis]|uniref:hypothetical protein n=1 Tax=Avibacterium endocarditidis TaxID=380674 RepID=UPI0011B76849|nr:hypothetical protein [Avibacterium endocarditidis]